MDLTHRDDLTRTGRLVAGDEAEFKRFFDDYFPRLFRFVLPRVRYNDDLAEELVQAALCKAIRHLASFRGEASLFTWLCTFCRHELSHHYRKAGARSEPEPLAEDSPEIRAALESLALQTGADRDPIERAEVVRQVHAVLDQLPPHYGDSLEWKYTDGLSVKEIAERLGVSPKAAESLLTRARQAFRDAFLALTSAAVARTEVRP